MGAASVSERSARHQYARSRTIGTARKPQTSRRAVKARSPPGTMELNSQAIPPALAPGRLRPRGLPVVGHRPDPQAPAREVDGLSRSRGPQTSLLAADLYAIERTEADYAMAYTAMQGGDD